MAGSKRTEELNGGVLVAAALLDLVHIAKANGSGGYDSRATTVASILELVIQAAPGLLNTLDELAAALGDDANFAATVTAALAGKQATLAWATAAEIRAGAASTKPIAPDQMHLAHVPQVLVDGATVAWDMALGFNARITLGGNRTIGTPTNPKEGLTYALEVVQDATGTRVPTLPASFNFGAAGAPTFSTAAGKRDFIFLYCRDAVTPAFRATFSKDS